jgi:hypothetical protein
LGETEKARFIETFMAFTSFSQNAFYQWREKALSPPLWVGWELLVMNLLSSPGGKEFWKERGYVFGNEYREYVEKVIMTKKPHPRSQAPGCFQNRLTGNWVRIKGQKVKSLIFRDPKKEQLFPSTTLRRLSSTIHRPNQSLEPRSLIDLRNELEARPSSALS